jgi:hypothetical protein
MKKYLVCGNLEGEHYVEMMSGYEIINRIDMSDCYYEELEIYDVGFGKNPTRLYVRGCWHDFKNPLYIKIVDENGKIYFDGYGTDH